MFTFQLLIINLKNSLLWYFLPDRVTSTRKNDRGFGLCSYAMFTSKNKGKPD